jgi:hypothetical protein
MNQEKTIKRDHEVAHEYYDCLTNDTTLIIWTLNPSVAADSQSYFHF